MKLKFSNNRLVVLAVALIGVIALVTAALVPYLSNMVSVTTSVKSPLRLTLIGDGVSDDGNSIDLGDVVGGSESYFSIREENLANKAIPAGSTVLVINVTENDIPEDAEKSCDEMRIFFKNVENSEYKEVACEMDDGKNLIYKVPQVTDIEVGHDETYDVKIEYDLRTYGSYSATVQHLYLTELPL